MYKIAVMGDEDSIMGFAALGMEIFPQADAAAAARELRRLAREDYAVVYVTEALAEGIQDEINRYQDEVTPAVILIPGISCNTGLGMRLVGGAIERAVGTDILADNQEERRV